MQSLQAAPCCGSMPSGDGYQLSSSLCLPAASSRQGTSMSTPVIAGSATLVRQYFVDGYYPSGKRNDADKRSPSAALVKAVLISGASSIQGVEADTGLPIDPPPSFRQGFGRVNLAASLQLDGGAIKLQVGHWGPRLQAALGSAVLLLPGWALRLQDAGSSLFLQTLMARCSRRRKKGPPGPGAGRVGAGETKAKRCTSLRLPCAPGRHRWWTRPPASTLATRTSTASAPTAGPSPSRWCAAVSTSRAAPAAELGGACGGQPVFAWLGQLLALFFGAGASAGGSERGS